MNFYLRKPFCLIFFVLVFSRVSFATEVVSTVQNAPDLLTVNVPFEMGEKPSRLLQYNYMLVEPRESTDSPVTVVWLGGGPAEALIRHRDQISEMFPPEVQILLLDYRGFGVNKPVGQGGPGTGVPEFINNAFQEFNSDTMASDVLHVLKALNINKYILFGQSFGTIIATKVAALAGENGVSDPQKVVLEGSIAGSPTAAEAEETRRKFNTLLKLLNPEVRLVFSQDNSYGYTMADWDMLFRYFVLANGGRFAVELLNNTVPYLYGTSEQIATGKEYLNPLLEAAKEALGESYKNGEADSENLEDLARIAQEQVASKILLSEVRYSSAEFVLKGGSYSVEQNTFGKELIRDFRPFSSKDWQIPSQVVYIHGELDTATYLGSGLAHAASQSLAPLKYFFTVRDGGHSPMSHLDQQTSHQFWSRVISGSSLVEGDFPNANLEVSAPNPPCLKTFL